MREKRYGVIRITQEAVLEILRKIKLIPEQDLPLPKDLIPNYAYYNAETRTFNFVCEAKEFYEICQGAVVPNVSVPINQQDIKELFKKARRKK